MKEDKKRSNLFTASFGRKSVVRATIMMIAVSGAIYLTLVRTNTIPDLSFYSLALRDLADIVIVFIAIMVAVICPLTIWAALSENRVRKRSRAKRVKARYPGLSVVGVYLDKFQVAQIAAQNLLSLSIGLYILFTLLTRLPIRWDVVATSGFFLTVLLANGFVTRYRIKKGYYLNSEQETRELIKFIKENADNIDFTGGNGRILSQNDLEDIVLGRIGYNPI